LSIASRRFSRRKPAANIEGEFGASRHHGPNKLPHKASLPILFILTAALVAKLAEEQLIDRLQSGTSDWSRTAGSRFRAGDPPVSVDGCCRLAQHACWPQDAIFRAGHESRRPLAFTSRKVIEQLGDLRRKFGGPAKESSPTAATAMAAIWRKSDCRGAPGRLHPVEPEIISTKGVALSGSAGRRAMNLRPMYYGRGSRRGPTAAEQAQQLDRTPQQPLWRARSAANAGFVATPRLAGSFAVRRVQMGRGRSACDEIAGHNSKMRSSI